MVSGRAVGISCILTFCGAATLLAAGSDVADAAKRGDKAAVRTLLAQKADVNAKQPDGGTALHWAVYREDVELATMLLRAGANANAVNLTGATPLSLAGTNGNAAIIELLLKAGVGVNAPLSKYNETSLLLAARTGRQDA